MPGVLGFNTGFMLGQLQSCQRDSELIWPIGSETLELRPSQAEFIQALAGNFAAISLFAELVLERRLYHLPIASARTCALQAEAPESIADRAYMAPAPWTAELRKVSWPVVVEMLASTAEPAPLILLPPPQHDMCFRADDPDDPAPIAQNEVTDCASPAVARTDLGTSVDFLGAEPSDLDQRHGIRLLLRQAIRTFLLSTLLLISLLTRPALRRCCYLPLRTLGSLCCGAVTNAKVVSGSALLEGTVLQVH